MLNFKRILVVSGLLIAVAFASISPVFASSPPIVSATWDPACLPLHTMEIPRYTLPAYRDVVGYPQARNTPNRMFNGHTLLNYWPGYWRLV